MKPRAIPIRPSYYPHVKIAITGGTGFVGRHLADSLAREAHEVAIVGRSATGVGACSVDDEPALRRAFEGCDAVAHCAGINREIGRQTYRNVHVRGTRAVVRAAEAVGARKIVLLSFLRARPACGSAYHESKYAAEEIARASKLDWTIVRSGVIYGRGDHILDHLSHALHTFPVFGLVGFRDRPIAPVAVADVVRILKASLVEGALSRMRVAVVGPEVIPLGEAVRRVAEVLSKKPVYVRLPIWSHYLLARVFDLAMKVPLVSAAQVRILLEGVAEPSPGCDPLPVSLQPEVRLTSDSIPRGLPPPSSFGLTDLRCCFQAR